MKKIIGAVAATAIAASLAFSSTVAQADVLWEMPDDPSEFSTWTEGLPPLDEATDISGESTADGLRLYFPEGCKAAMPNALISSASGLFELTEDDEIHLEATSQGANFYWSIEIAWWGAEQHRLNISEVIGDAAGIEAKDVNGYMAMVPGTYNVTMTAGEVVQAFDDANGTNYYDTIFAADSNRLFTHLNILLVTDSLEKITPDQDVVIKQLAFGTAGTFDATTAPSSTAPSTSSCARTSSTGSTTSSKPAATSSKGQVSTGESILPIVGIAALAVVATSAVVATKKRAK